MSDAKLGTVLSSLSQVARQLDVLLSDKPAPDASCVKLNTNENPFPLPTVIMQSAMAALERQYLYPEDDNVSLRQAAVEAYGVSKDQVIAGNGSSELLGLIYRAFLVPGDSVAMMSPGFSFNRKLATLQGAQFVEIELWRRSFLADGTIALRACKGCQVHSASQSEQSDRNVCSGGRYRTPGIEIRPLDCLG